MRFPIPQITAIMLVVHLGFGCCWHHAHTCSVNCCDTPMPTGQVFSCDAHAHIDVQHGRRGHDDEPNLKDERHSQHCDGGRCSFVRSEPLPEQNGDLRYDLGPIDVALSPVKLELLQGRRSDGQDLSLCGGGLPLRAHLLFSVLLI